MELTGWSAASAATAAMQTVATRLAATAAVTPGGQVSVAAKLANKTRSCASKLCLFVLVLVGKERKSVLNLSGKMFRHFQPLLFFFFESLSNIQFVFAP